MHAVAERPPVQAPATRREFYERIRPQHLMPLWEQMHNLVPREPASPCKPALWRFAQIKPLLLEAGGLITAEEAVRRVLILENPGMVGRSSITQSLFAGLQMILPDEIAPAHRHTQSALRFIVDGRGAFTAVNGERTMMEPGDFIITPSWTWHDHGNPGIDGVSEPVIWLDGLDVPMVRFFDVGFAEDGEDKAQQITVPPGLTDARYAHNMAPVTNSHRAPHSPIFSYPYSRSREALAEMQRREAPDAWRGWKLRYINPLTGGAPMPTIGTCLQLLPGGFSGKGHRSTDGTVYSVVEGSGVAEIGGERLAFTAKDIFVVPSWATLRLKAESECVLFSFSDRPVQEALHLHREAFLSE